MTNLLFTFVIDVGVGRSIEEWLNGQGFRVISIRIENPEMEDFKIIQLGYFRRWNYYYNGQGFRRISFQRK